MTHPTPTHPPAPPRPSRDVTGEYTVTTYRTRYEGVAGFGGRDVRSDEQTVTVADRAELVRELEANAVPGRMQHEDSGRFQFGGYVTEWAPVEECPLPTPEAWGPCGFDLGPRGRCGALFGHTGDHDPAGPLPRFGEVIRDAERYGAQMLAVLQRQHEPASAPEVAPFCLAVAASAVQTALDVLSELAGSGMPPVGSAVKTTRVVGAGEEPTPGSAAAVAPAARESAGVATPGAGVSSGPSPRRDDDTPPGGDVRRGAGPGYLGPVRS